MSVQPLRPEDIGKAKAEVFPDAVVLAFNELIAENWDEGSAKILKIDAVERIEKKLKLNLEEPREFDMNFLNVEDIYRDVGWEVEFDAPVYDEIYKPFFLFTKKEK